MSEKQPAIPYAFSSILGVTGSTTLAAMQPVMTRISGYMPPYNGGYIPAIAGALTAAYDSTGLKDAVNRVLPRPPKLQKIADTFNDTLHEYPNLESFVRFAKPIAAAAVVGLANMPHEQLVEAIRNHDPVILTGLVAGAFGLADFGSRLVKPATKAWNAFGDAVGPSLYSLANQIDSVLDIHRKGGRKTHETEANKAAYIRQKKIEAISERHGRRQGPGAITK